MFGRNKKNSPRAKAGAADTLISKEAKIEGDIRFSGVLYIDGHVTGDIRAEEMENSLLTIGANGYIEGEVNVPHVMVFGRVKGDVHAFEHIELMSNARIEGNVYYKLIEMAMGAEVNGQMHREEDRKLLGHHKETTQEQKATAKADSTTETKTAASKSTNPAKEQPASKKDAEP